MPTYNIFIGQEKALGRVNYDAMLPNMTFQNQLMEGNKVDIIIKGESVYLGTVRSITHTANNPVPLEDMPALLIETTPSPDIAHVALGVREPKPEMLVKLLEKYSVK